MKLPGRLLYDLDIIEEWIHTQKAKSNETLVDMALTFRPSNCDCVSGHRVVSNKHNLRIHHPQSRPTNSITPDLTFRRSEYVGTISVNVAYFSN